MWDDDPQIHVRPGRYALGYQGEGVSVTGCRDNGASACSTENGIYLRQPPYDDIEGRPHYIMLNGTLRRHLFYKPLEKAWQISPVCTDFEGAFALSATNNLDGVWRTVPPELVESNANVEVLRRSGKPSRTLADIEDVDSAPSPAAAAARPAAPRPGKVHDADLLKWEDR